MHTISRRHLIRLIVPSPPIPEENLGWLSFRSSHWHRHTCALVSPPLWRGPSELQPPSLSSTHSTAANTARSIREVVPDRCRLLPLAVGYLPRLLPVRFVCPRLHSPSPSPCET